MTEYLSVSKIAASLNSSVFIHTSGAKPETVISYRFSINHCRLNANKQLKIFTDKGAIMTKRVNWQTELSSCFLCTVPCKFYRTNMFAFENVFREQNQNRDSNGRDSH